MFVLFFQAKIRFFTLAKFLVLSVFLGIFLAHGQYFGFIVTYLNFLFGYANELVAGGVIKSLFSDLILLIKILLALF